MNKCIQTEIIINAPKEKVWNILTGFDQYAEWNPFIISSQGKLAKGERLTNTLLNGDKRIVFKPKVISVVRYQYFDWLGSLFIKGLFDGHHYFEIEELAPGQVKLTHGEHFSGVLSSYLLKRIGEDTRNNFIKMNRAVKQRAEAI
ncbi:MAG TPA: SRPBCC domain-containing protein [Flavisolibacter sp.]|nr:SRPBCC domain-containing protein [Flavisolibacter sp.]